MSRLDETIDRLIKDKDVKDATVRFNITLTKLQNRRAEYVSKMLNRPKQSLIEDLFAAALYDLEEKLGLWIDGGKMYSGRIDSDVPITQFFKDDKE